MEMMTPEEINDILQKAHERSGEVVAEFGCAENVRWADATLHHADGTIVKCKCGKDAENVFIGKESYLARCNECYLNPGEKIGE